MYINKFVTNALLMLIMLTSSFVTAQELSTLEQVKERGFLKCGVSEGVVGFSTGVDGVYDGFDVDYCRAIAAAVFEDPNKVEFIELDGRQRFKALQNGLIDVLSRNTTWTLSRDASLGLHFVGVNFYDGQGFITRKNLGIKRVRDLNDKKICVQTGTTTILNLIDYFKTNNLEVMPIVYDALVDVQEAFIRGECDAYTSDMSILASFLSTQENKQEYQLLEHLISKEPLSPMVRSSDTQWFNIARWTLFALIEAEEYNITKENVASFENTNIPALDRILGKGRFKLGEALGLDNKWAMRAIKAVGNYSEMFEANLGTFAKVNIPRGKNKLWSNGGILYAPPIK